MKIKKITLDSSVIISFLFEDEVNHDASAKLVEIVKEAKIEIALPMLILFEVFHNLRISGFFRHQGSQEKFKLFFNFEIFQYFDLNMKFFNIFQELPFFNNLKASDAIIAAGAFLNSAVLISWDKKMLKYADNCVDPEEFVKKFN